MKWLLSILWLLSSLMVRADDAGAALLMTAPGPSGAPPAFFPTDVGGLFAAYYAPSNSATGDGNPATQMTDISGNGRHLYSSDAARQPIWDADTFNGTPGWIFTSDNMTNANWTFSGTNMAVFMLIRQDNAAGATGRRLATWSAALTGDTTETGHHMPIRFSAANTNWGTFAEGAYRASRAFGLSTNSLLFQRYDIATITNNLNGSIAGFTLAAAWGPPAYNYSSIGGMINGSGQHEGFTVAAAFYYTNLTAFDAALPDLITWGETIAGNVYP